MIMKPKKKKKKKKGKKKKELFTSLTYFQYFF